MSGRKGPRWTSVALWLANTLVSGVIGYYVGVFLGRADEERAWARSYVLAMPERCRTSSNDFDAQQDRFLEAAKRARAGGRGIPVWREDCSIGAEYSITLEERSGIKENNIDRPVAAQ